MAFPDSIIYSVARRKPLQVVDYYDTEHYRITRDFLMFPEAVTDHLDSPRKPRRAAKPASRFQSVLKDPE